MATYFGVTGLIALGVGGLAIWRYGWPRPPEKTYWSEDLLGWPIDARKPHSHWSWVGMSLLLLGLVLLIATSWLQAR